MLDFDLHAQRIKLARALDVDEAALPSLAPLRAGELQELRACVTEAIYARHRDRFQRLARLSALVPAGLSATLAERALGSELTAGVTCEMDPRRAAKVSHKLSPRFLAELSTHLDPERAETVLAAIAPAVIVDTARELTTRREYITLARFVASLADETLAEVMRAIDDDVAFHQIGLLIERRDRLDRLLELLPDARRRGMLATAERTGTWPQTLALVGHLGDRSKGVMGDAAVSLGLPVLETLLAVTREHGLWGPLLTTIANMRPENRDVVVAMPGLQEPDTLRELLCAVSRERLWPTLARVWGAAPQETLERGADVLLARRELLTELLAHAESLPELDAMLARMPPALRRQLEALAAG
ncbi:MAG: hypothetical protein KC468_33600 [Myxococcales bacterium]|nr:hypothetical protein [Myxococcales bacterium]